MIILSHLPSHVTTPMTLFVHLPKSLWAAYNRSLQSRPLHTKAATSCVAFALGDMLAQRLTSTQNHQKLDCARTLRMAAFGALIAGPVGHHWYVQPLSERSCMHLHHNHHHPHPTNSSPPQVSLFGQQHWCAQPHCTTRNCHQSGA